MRASRPTIAILGYHKIGQPTRGGWETWFYVPEETFVAHLTCLARRRWQVIGLRALLQGLRQPDSLPERAAVLTFDDGYRSMRQVTLPCLKSFGFPAVLFVPTDYVGKTNSFDQDNEPTERICNWADLRALERGSVSVQSHGASHRPFSMLDRDQQLIELKQSKSVLERELEHPVNAFAFPYGDAGRRERSATSNLKRAGYQAAFLYGGGWCSAANVDPYRIPRLPIGPDTNLAELLNSAERKRRGSSVPSPQRRTQKK